jgi:6,7-dimethyl-8-ribityllumazine synthase
MERATTPKRIAFVQACWHREIIDQGRDGFLAEMKRHGVSSEQVDLYEVPGSLEIPLQAKLLAKTGKYSSIVAAGLVINGGIYRHEFVAQTVLDALMRIQLDTDVPIISMVLTPQHFHEHDAHQQFFYEHFKVKGAEAAVACVKTLENLQKVLA